MISNIFDSHATFLLFCGAYSKVQILTFCFRAVRDISLFAAAAADTLQLASHASYSGDDACLN